jgi:hypothetical protein
LSLSKRLVIVLLLMLLIVIVIAFVFRGTAGERRLETCRPAKSKVK